MSTRAQDGQSPQISYRLALASLVAAGVALLLAMTALIAIQYFALRNALLEDTRVKAGLIAESVPAAVMFQDAQSTGEILGSLRASPIVIGAAVIDSDSVVLASYPADFMTAAKRFSAPSFEHQFTDGRLEIDFPIVYAGRAIGTLHLVVSLQQMHRRLGVFAGISIGIALLALLVAGALLHRVRGSVERAEQELRQMALIDSVTGLFNRHAFNERLTLALDEARRFGESVSVLMIDLDDFKKVNDTMGHAAGDELLRTIARRFSKELRREDMVARLGGDEFAILLRGRSAHHTALAISAKLVRAMGAPIQIDNQEFVVTGSIGVATSPQHGVDAATLLRNADTAMYHAKGLGKNSFEVFVPEMNAELSQRVSLESAMRGALERGEFRLNYQPKIDLRTGSPVGLEALLRWNNPQLGQVSPVDFIPIAETTGLIVDIGEWVIRTALRDLADWNKALSAPLTVAVNLSIRQLREPNFVDRVSSLIAAAGVDPAWLELELTESMLMENVHANIESIQSLRNIGVRLAIDDFGTGYSSMAYLKRLPIDTLKIDRSFVSDLSEDRNDYAIAAAIVALGSSLGLDIVAEGIETVAQTGLLLGMGCGTGQGYVFARPMPADEVPRYLSGVASPASVRPAAQTVA